MPRFDGTGPRGQGPMTGRGEGYCALNLPQSGEAPYGYAGLQGTPVRLGAPTARPVLGGRFARWLRPATWPGLAFRRGRGRGMGRGRGRRAARW
ncbi:MAG TPA: hypothetical protein ENI37_06130 [Chloroflexi bacterium]|nr:hypothetical protein [Chloroflexota bacterium]